MKRHQETVVTTAQNIMSNEPVCMPCTDRQKISRRRFLITGWFGFLGFLFYCLIITIIDFFKPKVLHEAPMSFEAGLPEEYLLNTVSTKWIEEQKVWLIRSEKGLYAISAICTHLGCMPRWVNEEGLFKCPCHGSNFNINGDVIAGPAPSALWRFSIGLSENGQIVINKRIKESRFPYREGEKFLLNV